MNISTIGALSLAEGDLKDSININYQNIHEDINNYLNGRYINKSGTRGYALCGQVDR